VILLFLALGLGFSGYLLPWNDLSYFATLVGTEIPGSLPVVGGTVRQILRGGEYVTGDTITRFYAAHVMLLPLLLTLFAAFHVGFVQLQGMSLPLGMSREEVRDQEPFFSEFLLTDACVWLLLFGVIVTLAVWQPAEIGPEADTLKGTPKGIKPEWYFLFVFQFLKYVPESVGILVLVVVPLLLLALPLLDRNASREKRSPAFAYLFIAVLVVVALLQIRAVFSPSLPQASEELEIPTYNPTHNTIGLIFLWAVIGFLIYYLQRLRCHNRQLRDLFREQQA
jgi:cytochrome b6